MSANRIPALDGWRDLDDYDLAWFVADGLMRWMGDEDCNPNVTQETPLPRGQVAIFATWQFIASVYDEGVPTTLWNIGGVLPASADGFRLIGAPELATIVDEIIRFAGLEPFPWNEDERRQQVECLDYNAPQFEAFYNRVDQASQEGWAKMASYVRAHPTEFFAP